MNKRTRRLMRKLARALARENQDAEKAMMDGLRERNSLLTLTSADGSCQGYTSRERFAENRLPKCLRQDQIDRYGGRIPERNIHLEMIDGLQFACLLTLLCERGLKDRHIPGVGQCKAARAMVTEFLVEAYGEELAGVVLRVYCTFIEGIRPGMPLGDVVRIACNPKWERPPDEYDWAHLPGNSPERQMVSQVRRLVEGHLTWMTDLRGELLRLCAKAFLNSKVPAFRELCPGLAA